VSKDPNLDDKEKKKTDKKSNKKEYRILKLAGSEDVIIQEFDPQTGFRSKNLETRK
jgi:hypothetical protein